jgi:Tfp pilus assembly protein PilX
MKPAFGRQEGATLLVTLIMLVIITLFALTAFNTSNSNLKMVGNMQLRSEAMGASARTIEETISHPDFTKTPTNAIPNPCGGTPNTLCTDLNGDGVPDLTTTLTPPPTCDQGRKIKVAELHFVTSQDDLACVEAQQQGTFAVVGAAPTGDSLCGTTVWNIRAQTMTTGSTATNSDVNTAIVQGIGVRVPSLDVAATCP